MTSSLPGSHLSCVNNASHIVACLILSFCISVVEVLASAVGRDTTLKAGRSRVSIPDGVFQIFYGFNPFGRTMALVSTQPVTEMTARDRHWG